MTVMDAAISEALWRHTAQIFKTKLWVFKNIFDTDFYSCLILVTNNHLVQDKPNLWEEQL